MTTATTVDPVQSEAFAERMLTIMNDAALALMISIGHRTGLFDALDGLPSATSAALAERAGCDERYVREWLGAMTTGRLVTYDAAADTYHLPPEHAAWLTRRATPNNMGVFSQYIAVLGGVEDDIVECFRNGGGVPYSKFPRFHAVMAEDSGQTVLGALEEHILPLIEGIEDQLESGIDVLDVGCGSGRAMNLLATRYPRSRFVGYDISEDAIAVARNEAASFGLTNVFFEVVDATRIEDVARYDLITTFDAVHDQADPAAVLAGIRQALKPTGTYLMQDICASSHLEKNMAHPIAPFLYTISTMHCMTVSLAADGAGLGTCWGEETALEMLDTAGFPTVEVKRLPHDIQNNFYIAQPARS